jgi:NADH:ubiquinone oxidoreductase subunit C
MRLSGLLSLTSQNLVITRTLAAGLLVLSRRPGILASLLAVLKYSHLSQFSLYFLSFFETAAFSVRCGAVFNLLYLFIDTLRKELAGVWSAVSEPRSCSLVSGEALFASLYWQERECSEMLGLFFGNKSDRRVSFLPQLHALYPLRRSSPTGGFYEFGLDCYFERGAFLRSSSF